ITMPWRAGSTLVSRIRSTGQMPRYPESYGSARDAFCDSRCSERVPGRLRRILKIANIGPQPQSDAGADRHQHDVVGGQRRHAETTDDIGGAVDAGEALVDRAGGREIINQRQRARAIPAPIEAERWSLPEHPEVAGVLGVERTFAIAQPGHECAAAFL